MFKTLIYLLFISIFLFSLCECLEPISTTILSAGTAILGSIGYAGYQYVSCTTNECCDNKWIQFDPYGLKTDLENKLFGQHLVESIVSKSLKSHIQKVKPKKALVMSFHGCTGCGKNFVAKIISENLFKKGAKSQFYHTYIGERHFPHLKDVPIYRENLKEDIEKKTKECGRSVFVFDELDKIPPGILDVLTPYLDYHESIDGVDYRKNIFIFLSNAGAKNITKVALQFWTDGIEREKITLKELERLISREAYNSKSGLKDSDIIKREMIDVYIPFLPLEKKHVKQCVKSELESLHKNANIDEIADELQYGPDGVELFSVSGCKKISNKIDLYIQ